MNGTLFRSEETVGGGLPAMNDVAIFLTHRIDCIAGKPPPTDAMSIEHILRHRRPT